MSATETERNCVHPISYHYTITRLLHTTYYYSISYAVNSSTLHVLYLKRVHIAGRWANNASTVAGKNENVFEGTPRTMRCSQEGRGANELPGIPGSYIMLRIVTLELGLMTCYAHPCCHITEDPGGLLIPNKSLPVTKDKNLFTDPIR